MQVLGIELRFFLPDKHFTSWAISLASTIYSFELPSVEMFSYTENRIDPNCNVYHCILLVYDSEVLMGLTHEKMNRPNKSDPESHSRRE